MCSSDLTEKAKQRNLDADAGYKDAWSSIVFAIRDNVTGSGTQVTADQLTKDATKGTITLNNFNTLYPMEEHS